MLYKMEHTFWSLVLHFNAIVDSQPSAWTDLLGLEGGWRTWGSPQNIWESRGDICPALPRETHPHLVLPLHGDMNTFLVCGAWRHFIHTHKKTWALLHHPLSLHSMWEASLHYSKTRKLQRYQGGGHWSWVLSLHTGCGLQGEGPIRPRRSNVSLIVPRVPWGFKVEELLLLDLAPREGTSQSLLIW